MAKLFKKNALNSALASVFTGSSAILFIATTPANTWAQDLAGKELKTVVVTDRADYRTTGSEFLSLGDAALAQSPISVNIISSPNIEAAGAKRLADLTQFDASVSDAYNAVGYWDYVTVRGFVLDNKYNYRREGLPISAETFIALDNKDNVEILKGTSGIQAGTSAPGGLVNYTVKRPTQKDVRSVRLDATSDGSFSGAIELGGRIGYDKAFGYRINAAAEKIDHHTPAAKGNRQLLAVAADWRINKDSILEAEVEYSRRLQPSVPGMSLVGNALPAVNNKLNINDQAWSQPVVLEGLTGSVKFEQAINAQWRWLAQAGSQKLTSQDRAAFPFGCTDGETYYADRYCPNGNYDLYDFRSNNERRNNTSAKVEVKGNLETPFAKVKPTLGILLNKAKDTFQSQAYNFVGTGALNAFMALPANPDLTTEVSNRAERSTELYFNNAHQWTPQFTTWTGVRHTRLHRESWRTDGSEASHYSQTLSSRFVAASYQINDANMLYGSFGQGVESDAAPTNPRYKNAGEVLPALTSKQFELGMKGSFKQWRWSAAYFDIRRPLAVDIGSCDTAGTCSRQIDGAAKHRGIELAASTPTATATHAWQMDGGITFVNSQRTGSTISTSLNDLRPTNVPSYIVRLNTTYKVATVPGLKLEGRLSHEGKRAVLPDNSIMLPAWTRLDLGLSYDTKVADTKTIWSLGVSNVLNKNYFKESPYQFSHAYLFAGAPRTLRLSLQVSL